MNYAAERKLENVYALKNLTTLYKKPIRGKDYKHLKEVQDAKVQELMARAWDIPFYRKRFEESGTIPADYKTAADLYKFPVLTKAELRDWMDSEAAQNPEKYAHWHISPTSGSSGAPLRTLVSPKENAWMTANWLRVLSMPGFDPFTGKTMCRPNSLHGPVKSRDSIVQRFGILRRKQMSDALKNRLTSEQLLQEINDYKPDYLYNHKNVLVRVAAYVKKTGAYCHKPKFYTPFGEMMDEASRQLLTEVFGDGLVDAYGMSEVGSCVIRLPHKDEYQVNSDTHVVNIYDAELKNPADCGPAVITPLFKTDLPIINYVSGDSMDTYMKAGLRFVKSIQGRMNDVVKHRDGSVTEWGNVAVIMNWIREIIQYRMVQEDYENITLMMVLDPAVDESKKPELEAVLTDKLGTLLKGEFNFKYEWYEEIPSDANGKLRILVSKLS